MTVFLSNSKVKELQTMLFPIQPIPGGTLTSLQGLQELHVEQIRRFDISKADAEQSWFPVPLTARHQEEPNETLRTLLDARCVIDGITQEAARWPTECQVIPERIRHIDYTPHSPEPFYIQTGKEPKPKPVGDEFGNVIFQYCPTNVTNYFSRSCVGGTTAQPNSTEFLSDTTATDTQYIDNNRNKNVFFVSQSDETVDDNDLHFESRFESGNLGKVVKITDTYYQLYLRKDLYTQRHTQWYYFRISNTRSKTSYRLSIVNLCKEESLYNEGLRPLLYSTEDARKRAVGWRRCGENIAYYRNDSSSDEEKEKHTLTFNVSFPHDRDTVYLAHCYPYTYTDLQEYLAKIVADPMKTRFTKLRLLCRTLAGNGVYYLTITAPTYDEEVRRKRGVVITARVHPGETPSSWTMKGIIDFLTGDSDQAKDLREKFVFKLVPMLNPDGVIVGNNRCSLSGKDLNRQYRTVMRESYPSVWHTKLMIRRLLEECGVGIYCDLHAHSRKHNIFVYGCESKRCYARLSEQVFPLMLHKNAADKFSFENCKFHVEKGKEGTGRVVVWSMGVQNSYTMEASMGGSKIGSRSGTHFSTQDYEQIGKAFCETLLDFFDQDPTKEKLRTKIIAKLMKEGSSAGEPTNIDLTDYSSDEGDTSDSSVSDEEETDFPKSAYDYDDRDLTASPQYLCVPPPSPTFVPPRSVQLTRRRMAKSMSTSKNYVHRRKLLTRRAVMDLPTTDPGSDLCDLTDSGDETLPRGTGLSPSIREHQKEEIIRLSETEPAIRETEKASNSLILPEIVRPRSVSFGENLILCKEQRNTSQRSHCLRLSRTLKNPSTVSVNKQDIQIKLSSLRRQIWMGVPLNNEDEDEKYIQNSFMKRPLSWGVSNLALAQYRMDSETLLKSCSQKLQSLENLSNRVGRKSKKKSINKSTNDISDVMMDHEKMHQKNEQKSCKKKKSRFKWQRAINLSSRIKETGSNKASFLSIEADSLKLINIGTTTKQQNKQKNDENSRKYGRTSTTTPNIIKLQKQTQLQSHKKSQIRMHSMIVPSSDSSSSDNDSTDSHNQKITKKKQKKKKSQKKTKAVSVTNKKKRASSAKNLRNS